MDSEFLQRLRNLLSLAGLISAIFYGFLWLAYYQYYSSFAILPEQVGLDKVDLLSQALVGPIAILVLSILVVIQIIAGTIVISITLTILNIFIVIPLIAITTALTKSSSQVPKNVGDWIKRTISFVKVDPERLRLAIKIIIFVSFSFSLLKLLVPLYQEAAKAGSDVVERGRVIEDIFRRYGPFKIPLLDHQYGPFEIPLLNIQALPVEIAWKGDGNAPDIIARGTNCMLYLGKNSENTVLYDLQHRKVIYLSPNDIVVTTKLNQAMNPNCLDSRQPK